LHFSTTATDSEIDSLFEAFSLVLIDSLYGDHYVRLARTTADTPTDVITTGNRLYETGLFIEARAGLALPFEPMDDPDDEYYEYQWYLKNDGSGGGTADADIDFDEARDFHMPTTPIKIGVIDNGFEGHSDLSGSRLVGGWDYFYGDADVTPGQTEAHGVGCAGIIAAMQDNSEGIAGITGFNVTYVGQKIFADSCVPFLPCAATDAMIALAIDSCRQKGVKLISNSWGSSDPYYLPAPIDEALSRADSAGITLVFSSGNCYGCSWVAYPARHPKVIAVGATDRNDARWNYSMYGTELDVTAPSGDVNLQGDIWTLDRMNTYGYNPALISCSPQDVDYDCKFGGTSAACPQVFGVATLLMLRRPDLIGNTEQIHEIIRYSSDRDQYGVYDTSRVNNYVGWGRLNAARAILSVVRGDVDNNGFINVSDAYYIIN
jgi:serine protease